MKTWSLLGCLLLIAGTVSAQKVYQSYRLQPVKINPAILKKPVLLRADMTMVDQTLFSSNASSGARYLKVWVKNSGNLQSGATILKVKYSWRVDHESFTQRTLNYQYTVPGLPANGTYGIWVRIPDWEISSNEGFGSSHVSIRFEADGTNVIAESNEGNNRLYTSLPILH